MQQFKKKETKAFDKSCHRFAIGDTNTSDQWFWSISQGLNSIVKKRTKIKQKQCLTNEEEKTFEPASDQ